LLVYFRTVKYLSTARMPTGYGLKDKGQERQEAKTQDSQDDERLEAFKRKGNISRTVSANGKTGFVEGIHGT
jgi:hypothetical protein